MQGSVQQQYIQPVLVFFGACEEIFSSIQFSIDLLTGIILCFVSSILAWSLFVQLCLSTMYALRILACHHGTVAFYDTVRIL